MDESPTMAEVGRSSGKQAINGSTQKFRGLPPRKREFGNGPQREDNKKCQVSRTLSYIIYPHGQRFYSFLNPLPQKFHFAAQSLTFMAETESSIRFGIIGCAAIARKVSQAIKLAPNATITAIGSRSLAKAKAFAAANDFPSSAKIYGSYEEVLDDPDVDAVYVPLPTSLHVKWVTLAAQRKKHVLLEKPVALNVEEFDSLARVCEENGVQLMDGTMWMHHPRTAQMKEFLSDSNRFGWLTNIHSTFSYAPKPEALENDIRVKPDLDALGALGDAGWYSIRAILWAVDYELPSKVIALPGPVLNEAGVILACGASLHWNDNRVATFYCSFLSNMSMDIAATGTKGSLHVHDFIIPFRAKEASFTVSSGVWFGDLDIGWDPAPSQHVVTTDLPQEALMVKEFANLVKGIKLNGSKPEQMWPTLSRKTQMVVDAVKASIEGGFKPVEIAS